jgi:hypothetical protein
MLNLYLSGIDKTEILRAGTTSVETQLNARDQADFVLVSRDGSYRPQVGQPVIFTDAGTTVAGASATFTRSSVATLDGFDYGANVPRFQNGLWVEEATTNLCLNTDGLLATYTSGNVTQAVTPLTNFARSVQYGDNTLVRFAYKPVTFVTGLTYQFSAYVQMDDNSVPVPGGQTAAADFTIVIAGGIRSTASNVDVELISGSLYRVSLTWVSTVSASANSGLVKYTQNTAKGFRIAGYQIEQKTYRTSYAESGATAFTRTAESLTIPSTGWAAGSWTACLSVTRETRGLPSATNTLWQLQIDANNLYRLQTDASGVLSAVIISGGVTYSYNTGATLTYNALARIAWSGDGSVARVAVNGALVAEFSYVEPTGALPAAISIGSNVSGIYRDVALNTRWLDGDQLERLTATTPEWVTSAWGLGSSLAGTSAARIFGGTIESFDEMLTIGGQVSLEHNVRAVSWDALMDNRLVARAYDTAGQTMRDIVLSVIANEYPAEGINTDNVTTGPEIEPIKFNYDKASDCFDMLGELTGCSWWIDPYKNLYFAERAAILCPLNFLESSPNWRSISVERTRNEYRNRQYIKAGLGLTPIRTEYFVGDGTRKSFTLAYPAGKEPSPITVASVVKTVGIREVESGKNWYWQKNSPVINQDDGETAVGAGVNIAVTYQGQYPILVSATDDAALSDRATVEGGSGQYDHIEDEPNIDTVEAAEDRAYGLLRKYARIFQKATIATMSAGVRAGELTTLDIPTHGLSGQWLVEQTTVNDFNGYRLEYSMRVLDGESVGGWQGFFGALKRQARKIEYQDNEVILLLRSQPDTVVVSDSRAQSTAAPVTPLADVAICGYSELTT